MAARTVTVTVALTDHPLGELPLSVEADIFVPDDTPVCALYCLPGGGVNRGYFDLPGEGTSFARAMAQQGALVIVIDPIGVGGSSAVEDRWQLSAFMVSDIHELACARIARRLQAGTLVADLAPLDVPSVGVGHSLGAMLTILHQAATARHLALILLGFSTRGLPEIMTEAEALAEIEPDHGRSQILPLAQARFANLIAPVAGQSDTARALAGVQDKMLELAAMLAIMPHNVSPEATQIKAPIFLAVGDRDMTGRPERIGKAFTACRDITLHVVPGAGHHLFVAQARGALFAAMAAWLDRIAPRAYDKGKRNA